MEIYLIRHAIAEPRGDATPDSKRALTPTGIARFTRAVAGLEKLDVGFDLVFHSPWLRAAQTAKLLAPVANELIQLESLAVEPDGTMLSTAASICRRREKSAEKVAFVGHEPWMGELLSLLTLGEPNAGARFPFKKGGVARLEGTLAKGGCALKALWPPRTLRAVARPHGVE